LLRQTGPGRRGKRKSQRGKSQGRQKSSMLAHPLDLKGFRKERGTARAKLQGCVNYYLEDGGPKKDKRSGLDEVLQGRRKKFEDLWHKYSEL